MMVLLLGLNWRSDQTNAWNPSQQRSWESSNLEKRQMWAVVNLRFTLRWSGSKKEFGKRFWSSGRCGWFQRICRFLFQEESSKGFIYAGQFTSPQRSSMCIRHPSLLFGSTKNGIFFTNWHSSKRDARSTGKFRWRPKRSVGSNCWQNYWWWGMQTIFLTYQFVRTRRQTVARAIQRSVCGLNYSLRGAGQQNNK